VVARSAFEEHHVAADEERTVIANGLDRAFEQCWARSDAGHNRIHEPAGADPCIDQLAYRS